MNTTTARERAPEERTRQRGRDVARFWPLAAASAALGIILLGEPGAMRAVAALGLVLLLGHVVATRLLTHRRGDLLGPLTVAWTLGVPLVGMVFLACYHLGLARQGPLHVALLTAVVAAITLLPAWLRLGLPWPRPLTGRLLAMALAVMILAAGNRVARLGYADFQGDEIVNAVGPAVRMLQGAHGVLESARRPPLQAVVPAVVGDLAGEVAEKAMRLPVALSSVAAVYLVGVLAAGLFGPVAGPMAMLLLALDGLQVALGRIVQCQAYIGALLLLAACALWQARGDSERRPGWTWLAFLAWGLATVAHYEALLFAPLALLALVRMARSPASSGPTRRARVLACVTTVLVLVAVAYVPLVLSRAVSGHVTYYSSTRFRDPPNFNLPAMLETGWTYMSWTHLLLLILGLAAVRGTSGAARPSPLGFLSWWVVPNVLVFLILMDDPGTHVYSMFLPWTVAAAGGLARLLALAGQETALLGRRIKMPSRATCLAAVALLLAGSGWHVYTSFLRHDPEYPWPLSRARRPDVRLYGFPYHRGWRTAGWLFRTGALTGPYVTNEKDAISGYYLGQPPVDLAAARYAVLVHDPQSWTKPWPLPDGCPVVVRIVSRGRPAIDICERGAAARPVRTLEATRHDQAFTVLDRPFP